jgi:hypothetical protein
VQRTSYFNVWRRDRPATDVYYHFPLSGLPHERTPTFCENLAMMLRHAGPGAKVAYVTAPVPTQVLPASGVHPDYWQPTGTDIIPYGAGSDHIRFSLSKAGSYSLWITGSIGRPIKFILDGRSVGTVAYEERYPGQFMRIGARELSAGPHTLTLARGGGSLYPGSGDDVDPDTREVGPIVLIPGESPSEQVNVAPASAEAGICSAPVGYQWIEVLRPGAASA